MSLKEKAVKYKRLIDGVATPSFDMSTYVGKVLTDNNASEIREYLNQQIDTVTSLLDRKLIDMQTLFEIGRELNSTLNINDLLQIIIFTLMGQFQAMDVAIFMIDNNNADIIGSNGFKEMAKFPVSQQLLNFLTEKDSAVEISAICDFSSEYQYLQRFEVVLLIPMKGKDNVSGFIVVGKRMSEQGYNDEEKQFTYIMASLAAIALENARLFDELDKKYSELSTLYEVSKVINTTDDYDLVLSLIVETVSTGFGVKKAVLITNTDDVYSVADLVGLDEGLRSKVITLGDAENNLMNDNEVAVISLSDVFKNDISDYSKALFIPLISIDTKVGALVIFESDKYKIVADNEGLMGLYAIIASQIAPPIFMTKMLKNEKEKIQDPFTPVLTLIQSEMEKAKSYDLDVTFAMLKLNNFAKYVEFYGGEQAQNKFQEMASKIKKSIPDTIDMVRYSSNRVLFIMPAIAQMDFDETKDTILNTVSKIYKEDDKVDIAMDFLSAKYPDECQDKYSALALIE